MKPRWKRGTVLLQTMIMSLILSMLSVMLLKWVLARYMVAARGYRSTTSTARVVGNSQRFFSNWNFNATIPTCDDNNLDGQAIGCGISAPAANGMRTITLVANEDI